MTSQKVKIYHEKQSKQLCALHTLNNLFQNPTAFTKKELDEECDELSPESWNFLNPHRSSLGWGNYDINVMISVLKKRHYDMIWWDKRRNLIELPTKDVLGFVLNLSSNSCIAGVRLPFKSKHWLAIREIATMYYNFDSKLDHPLLIGDKTQLIEYLQTKLNDCELFIICSLYPCNLAVKEQDQALMTS